MATTKKTPARKAAPKSTGAAKRKAATTEKKAASRTFDFRGLKLTLPPTLPLSIAFAYRRTMRDEQGDAFAFLDLLEKLVGSEQYEAIERKFDEEGLTIDNDVEVLPELVEGVMGAFGTTTGE